MLRSGGAGRGRRRRAVRAAQGGAVVARAQSRSVRGACVARGAAAWWSRSGARAAAEGRRWSGGGGAAYGRGCRGGSFARRKKDREADAWGPQKD